MLQMGYGMTSPDPFWHPHGLSMFDVSGEAQGDGDDIVARVARPFGNLLQAAAGFCRNGTCKVCCATHSTPGWLLIEQAMLAQSDRLDVIAHWQIARNAVNVIASILTLSRSVANAHRQCNWLSTCHILCSWSWTTLSHCTCAPGSFLPGPALQKLQEP